VDPVGSPSAVVSLNNTLIQIGPSSPEAVLVLDELNSWSFYATDEGS